MGMRIAPGTRSAEPCECQHERRLFSMLKRAQIPLRYAGCTLENYQAPPELFLALNAARRFIEIYPGERDGTGLLFTGSVGVGKTHLATAIAQKLILEKGVPALFVDYRELLKAITHSYNAHVHTTELEVLAPVFEAEVLLLDELGAAKPTEWVWETVAHILNARYNNKRTTIITTNYANLPPGAGFSEAKQAVREETLGDRIGERMRSRLQEMCVPVEMRGPDYRQGPKRARFS